MRLFLVTLLLIGLFIGLTLVRREPEPTDGASPQHGSASGTAGSGLPARPPALEDGKVFEDVTQAWGIDFCHEQSMGGRVLYIPETSGAGCATVDYDRDGHLDIFLVQGSGTTDGKVPKSIPAARLYRGLGQGKFEDVTGKAGLDVKRWGMGCLFFDHDNDGLPDLFLTAYGETDRLYHQQKDHTFRDVTRAAGLESPGNVWSTSATAIDYDRDGFLDLYVGSYLAFKPADFVPNPRLVTIYNAGDNQPATFSPFSYEPLPKRLLRNKGDGTFEDVTAKAGVANTEGKTLAALAVDLNNDGWTDLFLANDVTPKSMFINQRDGTFKDEAKTAWVADIRGSMGLACGDIDNDGAADVYCTHWISEPNALYRNNLLTSLNGMVRSKPGKRITFSEISENAGIAEPTVPYVGWGCALIDLDRDGFQDTVHVNGHTFLGKGDPRKLIAQEGMVFMNRGDRTFRRVKLAPDDPLAKQRVSRGMAVGDLDEDGRPDLVVCENNGPAAVLRNRVASGGHWFGARLEGTRPNCNRDAIGAMVTLAWGELALSRWRVSGDSFLSTCSDVLHWGLPGEGQVKSLLVRWPDGSSEEFGPFEADRVVTLSQGKGRPALVPSPAAAPSPGR